MLQRLRPCFFLLSAAVALQAGIRPWPAFAADVVFTDFPFWRAGNSDRGFSVALGDIDGDGDLDLVCGNHEQPATAYRNQDGVFEAEPFWRSDSSDYTPSVALGDIDGDGDLDLVCGNYGQPTTAYRNQDGVFETDPFWHSSPSADTWSVALGDLDGDGDLDLVCAGDGQYTVAYRNRDGVFESNPFWSSNIGWVASRTVVLAGDIDGDGDIDLVCGNSGKPTTVYRNQDGVFEADPFWHSGPSDYTSSVALGDLDGDGDLDLICGNSGQPTTAYRNQDGIFETDPFWRSRPSDATTSVALGDLDGDGDLDLICGNWGQPTTAYRNQGGVFEIDPFWRSGYSDATETVAFGDLNGDGHLDLVCGNYEQPATAYLNQSGPFETDPIWRSGYASLSFSVALGDLDADGDIDLVYGNSGQSTAYRNQDGIFEADPFWLSGPSDDTYGVALGDLDGDGDLDLVCGNYERSTAAYRNQNGIFQTDPFWRSGYSDSTATVALGDLDGDGDLDLVCGNYEHTATAYRNQGGVFETYPFWRSGPSDATISVALGDLDVDGDLDLVCGNPGRPTTAYRNQGGVFETDPFWRSGPSDATYGVALGDLDGDGDLDLVCGNSGRPTTAYRNQGGVFETDPFWRSGPSDATYGVALGDLDGDGDLDLVCGNSGRPTTAYRNQGVVFEANPFWRSGPSSATTCVALGDVDRDGDLDLACGNQNEPATIYSGAGSPAYRGDPRAPTNQLSNNPAFLRFMRIGHTGRNLYQVSFQAIDVEADPVWIAAEWQFEGAAWNPIPLSAGTTRWGPLESSPEGVTHLFDWDVSRIPVDTPPIALRLRAISYSHTGGPIQQVPTYLYQAGKLDIRAPRMRLPSTPLSFPATTAGDTSLSHLGIWNLGTEPLLINSLDLPSPNLWTDVVFPLSIEPGTEGEIPILFAALDSAVTGAVTVASNDVLFPLAAVPMEAPVRPLVFTVANLYPSREIAQGTPLTLSLVMKDSVRVDAAWVFYRPGGAEQFASRSLTRTLDPLNEQYAGIIPPDSLGTQGVEYQIRVANGPVNVWSRLFRLQVRVTNLAFPSAERSEQYRLVTVPLRMEGTIAGSLLDDLGGPDPAKWRLFAYDAPESTYHEVPDDRYFRWELGRGYWVISRASALLDTGPEVGLSTPTDSMFVLPLTPGWNLVGNPFAFPVAWNQIGADGTNLSFVEPPVRWDENAGEYDPNPVSVLQPFAGYWVENQAPSTVLLRIPPSEAPAALAAPRPGTESANDDGWQIRILASSGTARDVASTLGEDPKAAEGWDSLDRSDPPLSPGPALSLYFPHPEWNQHSGLYTVDLRPRRDEEPAESSEEGTVWVFDVRTAGFASGGVDAVHLEFEGISHVPAEREVVLVDRVLGATTDLRADPRYTYFPEDQRSVKRAPRFELRVGPSQFVNAVPTPPASTRLLPNRPNPFRSNTVVRYEVSKPGEVSLRIYDLGGRLVKTLEQQERLPGRYEVAWRGDDDRNATMPPGVYFLRLVAPGSTQTRKLLRIE